MRSQNFQLMTYKDNRKFHFLNAEVCHLNRTMNNIVTNSHLCQQLVSMIGFFLNNLVSLEQGLV